MHLAIVMCCSARADHMYACKCAHGVCMCVYVWVCERVYVCVYMCMCVYMCTYVCECVTMSRDQSCMPAAASSALRRLQSLHWLLTRRWAQIEAPPQFLHWLLWRLCGQMLAPPQSLQRLRSQGRTGAPCRALPAHTPSQQLLLASQLQRHPARVLVRGCYNSLQLMLDLRSRTVLPAPQRAAPRPARGRSLL